MQILYLLPNIFIHVGSILSANRAQKLTDEINGKLTDLDTYYNYLLRAKDDLTTIKDDVNSHIAANIMPLFNEEVGSQNDIDVISQEILYELNRIAEIQTKDELTTAIHEFSKKVRDDYAHVQRPAQRNENDEFLNQHQQNQMIGASASQPHHGGPEGEAAGHLTDLIHLILGCKNRSLNTLKNEIRGRLTTFLDMPCFSVENKECIIDSIGMLDAFEDDRAIDDLVIGCIRTIDDRFTDVAIRRIKENAECAAPAEDDVNNMMFDAPIDETPMDTSSANAIPEIAGDTSSADIIWDMSNADKIAEMIWGISKANITPQVEYSNNIIVEPKETTAELIASGMEFEKFDDAFSKDCGNGFVRAARKIHNERRKYIADLSSLAKIMESVHRLNTTDPMRPLDPIKNEGQVNEFARLLEKRSGFLGDDASSKIEKTHGNILETGKLTWNDIHKVVYMLKSNQFEDHTVIVEYTDSSGGKTRMATIIPCNFIEDASMSPQQFL